MSLFQNRTKSDLFYLEVFSLVYEVMSDDFINGPIIGTDAGGIGFNKTQQFINSGKDTPGEDLKSLYQQLTISTNALIEEDFKSRNDRIYFGWLYDQHPNIIKNYLREFFAALDYPEEDTPEPEVVPNNGEEEVPVYLVKSSIPNGPQGQIYFEFRSDGPNKTVSCLGEMNRDTYNSDENEFEIVIEDSSDFNYEALANLTLQGMNDQVNLVSGFKNIFRVLSIVQTDTEPPQNFYSYTIIGKVVDSLSQEPLEDVYITDDVKSIGLVGSNINSEPTGDFILRGEYQKNKTFDLTFSLPNYQAKTITPFSKNNLDILVYKRDVGIIELNSALPSKKEVITDAPLPDIEVKAIAIKEKMKDPMGFASAEIMQSLVRTAKTVLLPAVLALIAKFGIPKAKEMLGKKLEDIDFTCPGNLEELKKIIISKNKLTKQLNNIFKTLEGIKVAVEIGDKIITAADLVANVLSTLILALPTVPFAPPLAGPLTTKVPTKNGLKDAIQIISEILGKLKILSSSILLVLNVLIGILQEILNYMALLDILIQDCYIRSIPPNESNSTSSNESNLLIEQESISNDLLEATQQQLLQGNPVVTKVNGFIMDVVPVKDNTDNKLKRRQSIAKNKAGVILLKGEPSFSSNDQILINELVYYIQINDLKAD